MPAGGRLIHISARGVLRPGSPVIEKYEFIESCKLDSVKYAYPVKKMCRWLEVSPSGFFDWKRRPQSPTAARRADLTAHIVKIFDDSDETYGYRRVHAELRRRGVQAGPELVRAIMRDQQLVPCQPPALAGQPHRQRRRRPGDPGPGQPRLHR